LGFNNGFESTQNMLDFYNKTFQKVSHVEIEVTHYASAEVVCSQEIELRVIAEVIDPQQAINYYIVK
jgi:hypothetical protein